MTIINPITNSPVILWDNVLTKGALSVTGTFDPAGPVVNATTPSTNDAWICTNVGGGTITVALAASTTCSMVGIAAHDLVGKSVAIRRWDGAAFVTVATHTPTDNQPFMIRFSPVASDQWRVSIASGPFRIGVAFVGTELTIPGVVQPPHTPLHLCEEVELMGGVESRSGQYLGQDVSIFGGNASVKFEVQQPAFVLADFEAFRQHFNRGGAFFMACAGVRWPDDMGYCWRDGEVIVPPFRDAVFMDLQMDVKVYRG